MKTIALFMVMAKINICNSYGYGNNSFGHEKCQMGWRWEGEIPPGGDIHPPYVSRGVISPPHASFYLSKVVDIPPPSNFFFKNA